MTVSIMAPGSQGPTPTPSFSRPTPTPQPTFLLYTVARGDTLTRIAKKFQTTGESVSYWNRAMYPSLNPDSGRYRPNDLKVGWVLQIIPKTVVDPENLPTVPPSPEGSGFFLVGKTRPPAIVVIVPRRSTLRTRPESPM